MAPWVLYSLLAALSAALVWVLSKAGISGVDSTVATSIRGLVIGLFMGSAALYLGKWSSLATASPKALSFIVLAALAGGLSWLWGFMALKAGGDTTAVNALDKLSLVLVLVLGAVFLGEQFTWAKFFGAILVVTGTLLISFPFDQILGWLRR